MVGLLATAFVFLLMLGCSPPVVKLQVHEDFKKLPLRVAAILPEEYEAWIGQRLEQEWTGYKVSLPMSCYDQRMSRFRLWREKVSVRRLSKQARDTFQRNLPLLFTEVDFLEDVPRNPESYDVLFRARLARWPKATDPSDPVIVEYKVALETPAGRHILETTVQGNARVAREAYPIQFLTCPSGQKYDITKFYDAYMHALGRSHADVIIRVFNRQDVLSTLQAYAEEIQRNKRDAQVYARLAPQQPSLDEQVREIITDLLDQLPATPPRTIAVTRFQPVNGPSTQFHAYLAEELLSKLAEAGPHAVVERSLLEKALAELRFSQTDLVDPHHAGAFGQMTGADTVLVGSTADLDYWIMITARLVETETGTLLAASSRKVFKHKEVRKLLSRQLAAQRGP